MCKKSPFSQLPNIRGKKIHILYLWNVLPMCILSLKWFNKSFMNNKEWNYLLLFGPKKIKFRNESSINTHTNAYVGLKCTHLCVFVCADTDDIIWNSIFFSQKRSDYSFFYCLQMTKLHLILANIDIRRAFHWCKMWILRRFLKFCGWFLRSQNSYRSSLELLRGLPVACVACMPSYL